LTDGISDLEVRILEAQLIASVTPDKPIHLVTRDYLDFTRGMVEKDRKEYFVIKYLGTEGINVLYRELLDIFLG